ncbi:MAG: glycosyltransferase family 2 protein [Candidatus Paceibacteria bacterium]
MKFSVVIPTYKRSDALQDTIASIWQNFLLPDEVIVIDDDLLPNSLVQKFQTEANNHDVAFFYYQKNHDEMRRGLSESKNWAVSLAQHEIICYLDDDVVLDKEYFSELIKVWEGNYGDEKLMGVGGCISNNRPTSNSEKIYRRIFGLAGECDWDVNDIGFQVWDEGVSETQKSYYLHGGVSSYRRELLKQYPFEVFSGGRTGLEDVEHCLRSKQAGYHFYYVPTAHLTHHPAPAGREAKYESGKKEAINRKEIFKKHCNQDFKHKLRFFWASIGWLGKKLLSGNYRGFMGMLSALI